MLSHNFVEPAPVQFAIDTVVYKRENPPGATGASPSCTAPTVQATCGSPFVQDWLTKHKSFHAHLTPYPASWSNRTVYFLRDFTVRNIRYWAFRKFGQLITAICNYIDRYRYNLNPFNLKTGIHCIPEEICLLRSLSVQESVFPTG